MQTAFLWESKETQHDQPPSAEVVWNEPPASGVEYDYLEISLNSHRGRRGPILLIEKQEIARMFQRLHAHRGHNHQRPFTADEFNDALSLLRVQLFLPYDPDTDVADYDSVTANGSCSLATLDMIAARYHHRTPNFGSGDNWRSPERRRHAIDASISYIDAQWKDFADAVDRGGGPAPFMDYPQILKSCLRDDDARDIPWGSLNLFQYWEQDVPRAVWQQGNDDAGGPSTMLRLVLATAWTDIRYQPTWSVSQLRAVGATPHYSTTCEAGWLSFLPLCTVSNFKGTT